ncbi:MAG: hypothetical protein CSA81_06650 [Acidobacteria bacterium]|nr:MAG: hypothetical protein CSA81_06650 [Acidobacteriota bacterium]
MNNPTNHQLLASTAGVTSQMSSSFSVTAPSSVELYYFFTGKAFVNDANGCILAQSGMLDTHRNTEVRMEEESITPTPAKLDNGLIKHSETIQDFKTALNERLLTLISFV